MSHESGSPASVLESCSFGVLSHYFSLKMLDYFLHSSLCSFLCLVPCNFSEILKIKEGEKLTNFNKKCSFNLEANISDDAFIQKKVDGQLPESSSF